MGRIHIMISPAKKMNCLEEYPVEPGKPVFLERTKRLMRYLQSLDGETIQRIWKCNDKIADLNRQRLKNMDPERFVTPAVLAYEGLQYQSMAPAVFEDRALDYIGDHLYILSGFYGILKAFDGVVPYRLEMQARITMEDEGGIVTSLYDYWGDSLYRVLADGADVIVNLASEGIRLVDCVFGQLEEADGKERVRVKATEAKMARGAMVRYMAQRRIEDVEELKEFDQMGYGYREELSKEDRLVFVKPGKEKNPLDK